MNRKVVTMLLVLLLVGLSTTIICADSKIETDYTTSADEIEAIEYESKGQRRKASNDNIPHFTNIYDAWDYVIEMIYAHQEYVSFTVTTWETDILNGFHNYAHAHTGDPRRGEAMREYYNGYEIESWSYTKENAYEYYHEFTYRIYYKLTAEELAAYDQKVSAVMESLDLEGKHDAYKAYAVFDYVINNVTYDYEHYTTYDEEYQGLQYTAYAALMNGTAVCEGYSRLVYRLMLEAGIDCRVIDGHPTDGGSGHAWNIVKIGDLYYNIDATWSASPTTVRHYFLQCNDTFGHYDEYIPLADIYTDDFWNNHPMAMEDYPLCSWTLDNGILNVGSELGVVSSGMFTQYGQPSWDTWGSDIISLIIDDGVVCIGKNTFVYWRKLEDVHLPDGLKKIEQAAFKLCMSLKSIQIPDSVTAIDTETFRGCSSLSEIDLPLGLTEISDGLFDGCYSLTTVGIPQSILRIGEEAFQYCKTLEEISIPDGVLEIGDNAFKNCSALSYVFYGGTRSEWETITIGIGNECLTGATIICADELYDVIDQGYCGARGNKTAVSWTLTRAGMLTITGTGDTCTDPFYGEQQIRNVIIGDGVKVVGENIFNNCSSLRAIHLSKTVENASLILNGCSRFEAFSVDPDNPTLTAIDGVLYSKDLRSVLCYPPGKPETCFTVPEGTEHVDKAFRFSHLTSVNLPESVQTISGAFTGCTELESIIIPDSVNNLGDNTFSGCSSLSSVEVPVNISVVGESAFQDCVLLKAIAILGEDASIADNAFFNCRSLADISFSGSLKFIGSNAFNGCISLKSIVIPSGVTAINDSTFYGCTALTAVSIPTSVISIGEDVFSSCTALVNMVLPANLTSLGRGAFWGCEALTGIAIPAGVSDINSFTFYGCSSLKNVIIEHGPTNIQRRAFYGCDHLISIAIPKSLVEIDTDAFDECIALADIYYGGSEENWSDVEIGPYNDALGMALIHYNSENPSIKRKTLLGNRDKIIDLEYIGDLSTVKTVGDTSEELLLIANYGEDGRFIGFAILGGGGAAVLPSFAEETCVFWVDESLTPLSENAAFDNKE